MCHLWSHLESSGHMGWETSQKHLKAIMYKHSVCMYIVRCLTFSHSCCDYSLWPGAGVIRLYPTFITCFDTLRLEGWQRWPYHCPPAPGFQLISSLWLHSQQEACSVAFPQLPLLSCYSQGCEHLPHWLCWESSSSDLNWKFPGLPPRTPALLDQFLILGGFPPVCLFTPFLLWIGQFYQYDLPRLFWPDDDVRL